AAIWGIGLPKRTQTTPAAGKSMITDNSNYNYPEAGAYEYSTTETFTVQMLIYFYEGTFYAYWPDGTLVGSIAARSTVDLSAGPYLYIEANYGWSYIHDLYIYEITAQEQIEDPFENVFDKGNGTESDPYIIETAEQLKQVVGVFGGGKFFKLANDIYINNVSYIDWSTGEVTKSGYTPTEWFSGGTTSSTKSYIGNDGETKGSFSGTIDGDGYTVYGVWYPADSNNYVVGLIPDNRGSLKNIKLANSFIKGTYYTGGISSVTYGTTSFDKVVVDDTVYINGTYATNAPTSAIGGFVGYSEGVNNFNDCAFYGNIAKNTVPKAFGLVGDHYYGAEIHATNSVSLGCAPFQATKNNATTVAQLEQRFTASNVYTDTAYACEVTVDSETFTGLKFNTIGSKKDAQGAKALMTMPNLFAEGTSWYATTISSTYPQLILWGEKNNDIDKSGIYADAGDLAALRLIILGTKSSSDYSWTEVDDNAGVDILDLVTLSMKKVTAPEYEYHMVTASGNSIDYKYVDWTNPEDVTVYYQSGYSNAATELQSYYSAKGITVATKQGEPASSEKAIALKSDSSLESGTAKVYVNKDVLYFVVAPTELVVDVKNNKATNTMSTAVSYFEQMSAPLGMAPVFEISLTENDSAVRTLNGTSYYYAWGDEFNGTSLDSSKWTTGVERMSPLVGTLSDNAQNSIIVNNGSVTLRNYKDSNGNYVQPRCLQTTGTMNFRYGYVEIQAQVPFIEGGWPSFWMNSLYTEKRANRKTPYTGVVSDQAHIEYDVLEVMGTECQFTSVLHNWYAKTVGETNYSAHTGQSLVEKEMCNAYSGHNAWLGSSNVDHSTETHTYGFEWTPEKIVIYFDGAQIAEMNIDQPIDTQEEVDNSTIENGGIAGIFESDNKALHDPQQLLFNNHFRTGITSNTGFSESNYVINYVRVYQNKDMNDSGANYGAEDVLYSGIWTN
ncbi:MAG: family 16 glycosylhydrolase, partial [Clostridia bacterium]|nr:family 16 glycosylhydrolase [Clostridia bacterium]